MCKSKIRQQLENQYSDLCESFENCVGCPHREKRNSRIGCDEDAMSDFELRARVSKMAQANAKNETSRNPTC